MASILASGDLWPPFFVSLRVAGAATLLALLCGVPLGLLLSRRRLRGRAAWEGLLLLPLVLPPTVLGYYLLVAFGRQSPLALWLHRWTGLWLTFTWQGAALAASVVSLPLLARTAQVAFAEIDPELIDMARTLGATRSQIFRFVMVPLARRGLIAGTGLAFARALGEFGATLMIGGSLAGETKTLPIALYQAWEADDQRAAGLYTLLLSLICLLFSVAASALTSRRDV